MKTDTSQGKRTLFVFAGILLLMSIFAEVIAGIDYIQYRSPTYILCGWIIPAVVGVLLLIKLPNAVFGMGFLILAVCQVCQYLPSLSDPWILIFELPAVAFYVLLAEAFLLKKLPSKKLSIVYAFVAVLSCLISLILPIDRYAIEQFVYGSALQYIAPVVLCAGQVLALAAATKESDEKLHPIGMIGLGVSAFGFLLRFIIIGVSNLIYGRIYVFDGYAFTGILWVISFLCIIAGVCLLPFACKRYTPKTVAKATDGNHVEYANGYISLGKHIALLLFTLGIWQYIWIYKTTAYLNCVPNSEQENPTAKLLLCMFVPFYSIYWLYKHGQRIDNLARECNLERSDMATMCLIFGIFIPIAAYILMQDRINTICTLPPQKERKNTDSAALENIQKLKALLDSGAITQEEFEAKKKEFLGI